MFSIGRSRQRKHYFLKTCLICVCLFLVICIWLAFSTSNYDSSTSSVGQHGSRKTADLIVKKIILSENSKQRIRGFNHIKWPPAANQTGFWPNGIVVTIQVHERVYYLKKLIESLARARWISRALLVFSHASYSEEINDVIRSIHFASVMQIYFPYSTQLYPSTFPGNSPEDCPRDIDKQKAIMMGCTNAKNPDMYGHYREAKFCQIKHHWWWKANFIFGKIRALEDYQGQVLFLEEDHYVAEDFLHVLWLQQQMLQGDAKCPFCNQVRMLSLGSHNSALLTYYTGNLVDLIPWSSSRHNMGMAFNRSVWNNVLNCANNFCSVDEYNWDLSLAHVARLCLPILFQPQTRKKPFQKFMFGALVMVAPRVFHLGECGFHQKSENCQMKTEKILRVVEESLRSARKIGSMFPSALQVDNFLDNNVVQSNKENGGWGDPRDRELCMSFTRN